MFNCNFNQQNWDYLLPYKNASLKKTNVVVSRGKENKQKCRNTWLATDENQYIYSYGKLVTKATLAYGS